MSAALKLISESSKFQNFITVVIILAGLLVGAETYSVVHERYEGVLHVLDQIVLWIFVAEVAVKVGAEGAKPWRYFRDPWNVFDFIVVAASFLPFGGQTVVVLRLVRLLRVLKLVRALPKLQLLVSALLKSIPSMAYVSVLLFLLFYVYGVAAVFLFGHNDPIHFGNLQIAAISLFRAVTLEDWTDLMYIQMYGCEGYGYGGNEALCQASQAQPVVGALFFISFVLLGTMIILNLFIGVIMNGMSEAQQEAHEEARRMAAKIRGDAEPSVAEDLDALNQQIGDLQSTLARLQRKVARASSVPEPLADAAE